MIGERQHPGREEVDRLLGRDGQHVDRARRRPGSGAGCRSTPAAARPGGMRAGARCSTATGTHCTASRPIGEGRRNTSSSRWRSARRSASGRSCSASHPVRAAIVAGVGGASTWNSPRRHPGDGRAQRGGEGVDVQLVRSAETHVLRGTRRHELCGGPVGHHASAVDDDDVVGDAGRLVQVVGRDEHADAVGPELVDHAPDQVPALQVDPGGRLVEQRRTAAVPTSASARDSRCCSPPDSRR